MQTRCPTAVFDGAEAIADAILYEGYLLYPYRRSSVKNRVRWQFGVLVPPAWGAAHGLVDSGVAGSAESSWQQTECLMEAPDTAIVRIRLRFLQLQRKVTELGTTDGGYRPVDRIEVGGRTELSFDEAVPREFDIEASVGDLRRGRRFDVDVPGGADVEPLVDDRGESLGRVVRRRWPLSASVAVTVVPSPAPFRLLRLAVHIENTDRTTSADSPREEALRCCLLAAHTLATVSRGRFLSLLDPPEWAAQAARECRNVHTFPVLAGAPGTSDVVLSSPIILYDHPRIAPESPGDLHDATEIDEILSLRTLTLSDAEKREARATDPRAAAIVDRVDAMPPEVLERLHGAIRSLEPIPRSVDSTTEPEGTWRESDTDAGAAAETETVLVAGTLLSRGSRVRLRPRRRGTDAHDMFLEGRTARVEQVLLDIDGSRFLAVTVDDDPGAELHQWYGRLRHFRPEEVEPLAGGGGGAVTSDGRGRILVAGIGNIFLADDAFGVEVVRRLQDAVLPEVVDVSDYGIRGMHLAYDLLDGHHDVLVMVDALPLDEPPGTLAVLQVDLGDPGWTLRPADVLEAPAADGHGMDPESVLRLLRGLGGGVDRILVVGCQPAVLDEHMGLSAQVAAAVDEAVRMVVEIVGEEAARLDTAPDRQESSQGTAAKRGVTADA